MLQAVGEVSKLVVKNTVFKYKDPGRNPIQDTTGNFRIL